MRKRLAIGFTLLFLAGIFVTYHLNQRQAVPVKVTFLGYSTETETPHMRLPASASSTSPFDLRDGAFRLESRVGGILRQNVPAGRKPAWRGPNSKFLL
jgi:hypothetical protein